LKIQAIRDSLPFSIPAWRDAACTKAIHSAFMARSAFFWATLALAFVALLSPTLAHARKKQKPTLRWTAGAPGCTFERGDDGRYRWTMIGSDLTATLLVDSQELTKGRAPSFGPPGATFGAPITA